MGRTRGGPAASNWENTTDPVTGTRTGAAAVCIPAPATLARRLLSPAPPVERCGNVNLRRGATMSGAADHTARRAVPQLAAKRPTAAAAAAARQQPCPAYFRPRSARHRSTRLGSPCPVTGGPRAAHRAQSPADRERLTAPGHRRTESGSPCPVTGGPRAAHRARSPADRQRLTAPSHRRTESGSPRPDVGIHNGT